MPRPFALDLALAWLSSLPEGDEVGLDLPRVESLLRESPRADGWMGLELLPAPPPLPLDVDDLAGLVLPPGRNATSR